MRHLYKTVASIAFATTATLSMGGVPAMAFTVTQNNNSSALLSNLLGNTTGLSDFTVTTSGNAAAFGIFSDDPFGLNSGIVLSTGKAADVVGPNNDTGTSTSFGTSESSDIPNSFDLAKLDISFNADSTVDKLFFQYVFGSEEFLEYAGSNFNDAFKLELNNVNLALLPDGKPVTINNLATSSQGPFNPAFINNTGNATQLDGFTTALLFEGNLQKNTKNTLSIKIADVGDTSLDSAVLIKGSSLGVANPNSEPVPEPLTILGSGLALGFGSLMKKYHSRKLQKTGAAE